MKTSKQDKRIRLKKKVRSKIQGVASRPRFSVFRSNKFIYAQLIDDTKGHTIVSASDIKMKTGKKSDRAKEVGKLLAAGAQAKKITEVVFDRNGFRYTGRVKNVADSARAGGLKF